MWNWYFFLEEVLTYIFNLLPISTRGCDHMLFGHPNIITIIGVASYNGIPCLGRKLAQSIILFDIVEVYNLTGKFGMISILISSVYPKIVSTWRESS